LRTLSELEGVCLGIVSKNQPCTAYQVRGELRGAPSAHWRASAGSVYPLLARLEEQGLMNGTDTDDGRGKRLMKVSTDGRKALRDWIMAGTDVDMISSVSDPVRSRVFFLSTLTRPQQLKYLEKLIELMEGYLSNTRAHLAQHPASDNLYEYFGSLGATKVTETRLEWVRTMYATLGNTK
jgi:DNA-binding PadR family transcriptional regulator